MISVVAALIMSSPYALTAEELWTNTLQRYETAVAVRGTIEFVQTGTAGDLEGRSVVVTEVAAKQPNLFSIRQTKRTGQASVFMAASDGKQMSFTAPADWQRISSRARTVYGWAPEKLEGALDSIATLLLDRQLPIALAVYNPVDVKLFSRAIRKPVIADEFVDGGRTVYRLEADFAFSRFGPADPSKRNSVDAWIPIHLYVTKAGDLLAMEYAETLSFKDQRTGLNISLQVVNRWNVNLQVNVPIDSSVFAVQ